MVSGNYCECDNFSCDDHNGELCSGEDHGECFIFNLLHQITDKKYNQVSASVASASASLSGTWKTTPPASAGAFNFSGVMYLSTSSKRVLVLLTSQKGKRFLPTLLLRVQGWQRYLHHNVRGARGEGKQRIMHIVHYAHYAYYDHWHHQGLQRARRVQVWGVYVWGELHRQVVRRELDLRPSGQVRPAQALRPVPGVQLQQADEENQGRQWLCLLQWK